MADGGDTSSDADLQKARDRLTAAAHMGFANHPYNCSGSIREALYQLQIYVPPNADANELMAFFTQNWQRVTMERGAELANRGKVVVGGLIEKGGHGHVQLVLPGGLVEQTQHGVKGAYPRSMSGGIGPWAKARSDGNYTVRDAWKPNDWELVTFWTPRP